MIIDNPLSIIIACDVGVGGRASQLYGEILTATKAIDQVGGYQIKSYFGLDYGLREVVRVAKGLTGKKIIYEHNTLGYGDPRDPERYAELFRSAGVDAVTVELTDRDNNSDHWIQAMEEAGVGVIARGKPSFRLLLGKNLDEEFVALYDDAIKRGVRDLQVPANRPQEIREIVKKAELLETPEIKGVCSSEKVELTFYPVGFGEAYQGGKIDDVVEVLGERFHPIVGRLIYAAPDINRAANEFIGRMNAALERNKSINRR